VSVKLRPKLSPGVDWTSPPMQPVEVQFPVIGVGDGVGCPMPQPDPAVEAVTSPEMPEEAMVPVIVPLIAQLEHAANANGMEKAPPLATTIVPDSVGGVQPWGSPFPGRGTPLGLLRA